MKVDLNYSQIEILFRNQPDAFLYRSINPNNFLITLLKNVQERFSDWNFAFEIKTGSEFQEEQKIPLSINQVDVGSVHLFYNSSTGNHSLVYYTPSELLETEVMDFTYYQEFTISDYFIILYEFCFILDAQKRLYEKI